jgi:signal transduction histidine kinase
MDRDALARLAEHLQEGLILLGPRLEVRVCNRAALRLLRLGGARPVSLQDVQERSGAALCPLVDEVLRTGRDLRDQDLRMEGTHTPRLRADALVAGRGRAGLLLLVREAGLPEAEQLDLLSDVSHELRSPLTSLSTALELVLAGEAGPVSSEQGRLLRLSERATERMQRMVEGVLDLARQRCGRLVLARRTMELSELLPSLMEQAALVAQRGGRTLHYSGEAAALAHVDPDRFSQVVDNLVGNALKFTPAGGHVTVTARAQRPAADTGLVRLGQALGLQPLGALVTVQDDGPGMERYTRERAFARYFQGQAPQGGRCRGAGLGLAIADALVRAHDGTIALESAPGAGTTFSVWVPADESVARMVGAVRAAEEVLARADAGDALPLILVVECLGTAGADAGTGLEHIRADLERDLARGRWIAALTEHIGVIALPAAAGSPDAASGALGDALGEVSGAASGAASGGASAHASGGAPGAAAGGASGHAHGGADAGALAGEILGVPWDSIGGSAWGAAARTDPRGWGPAEAAGPSLRAGWALFPADGADAGTLLAVAVGRARALRAASARDPVPAACKEEGLERSTQAADRR